jgi:pyruvate-formate lyase-activating enzyme
MRRWRRRASGVARVVSHLAREFPCPPMFEGATPTLARLLNLWLLTWEDYRIEPVPRSLPARLCVESTSACNLACPHCFTGAGEVGRPAATLSLDFYRRLLAELGDHLWQIEFHNWGEPLLNKHLFTMVAEATARGLSTSLCTNFSFPFDEGRAEQLVRSGLKVMGVSIDGARQQTYKQYRVRGRLDRVLHNVRLVGEAKRRLGSPTPRVIWGFHMFAHNVGDVEAARTTATELGIEFHVSRGRVVGPDWDPDERWVPHESVWPIPCPTLFHTAVVYGDGSVAPCRGSFYAQDDLGRMAANGRPGATTFREVWTGEGFQIARRLFRERTETPQTRERICFDCPHLLDFHGYLAHLALGGRPTDWRPAFDSNRRYNYFWSRAPDAGRTARAMDRFEQAASHPLREPGRSRIHGTEP